MRSALLRLSLASILFAACASDRPGQDDRNEGDHRSPDDHGVSRGPGYLTVEVFPLDATVRTEHAVQFVAQIAGGGVNQFTLWSVEEPGCGSFADDGGSVARYTAPSLPPPSHCTMRATSLVDEDSYLAFPVYVDDRISPLFIRPSRLVDDIEEGPSMAAGVPVRYVATEDRDSRASIAVTWSIVQLSPVATVDSDGTVLASIPESSFNLVARAANGRATSVFVRTLR